MGIATGNTTTTNLASMVFPLSMPFNFSFNGISYNALNVASNGYITFGTTAPTTASTTPLSATTTYDGAISAFGRSLSSVFDISSTTGSINWEMVGAAPNRELVIEWKNFRPATSTSTTLVYVFSFQIRLQETSNVIKMVYNSGSYLVGTTAIASTAQVGLRGATNTDYKNRLNSTSTDFTNALEGIGNTSSQSYNTSVSPPGTPTSGLTYTWTPPTCFVPGTVTTSNIMGNSATVSWLPSNNAPSGYDVYYTSSNVLPTPTTVPNISNVSGTLAILNSLLPFTTYYVYVRANCGAGNTSIWTQDVVAFSTTCQPSAILTTTPALVCPNQTGTLSATANPGIDINWYDAPTSGNFLITNPSYTTPPLAATTNYYVSASTGTSNMPVSKTIYSPSPSSGAGTTNFGIVFDALTNFTLEKVTIYPVSATGASGTVIIDVVDGNSNILATKTANVVGAPTSAPVAQVIDLNFNIVAGTNYKLRPRSYTGISGILFDPSANAPAGSYGYPFSIAGIVAIKQSTLTAPPANTARLDLYYYFYDWKVSTKCESARTMVTATVSPSACLSTSEVDGKNTIKVYPNPFSEVLNIDTPELIKSISLTDTSGRLIKSIIKPESVIKLNNVSNGMYILSFELKDGTKQSVKVIKN